MNSHVCKFLPTTNVLERGFSLLRSKVLSGFDSNIVATTRVKLITEVSTKFTHAQLACLPIFKGVFSVKKAIVRQLMISRSGIKIALHSLVVGIVLSTVLLPQSDVIPLSIIKINQIKTVVASTVSATFQQPITNFHLSQDFFWYHQALDLACALGTPVFPVTDGMVTEAGWRSNGHGKTVVVDHGDGLVSLYAHLGVITTQKGDQVDQKSQIGTVGLTGFTSGPHLHIEMFDDGKAVNPKTLLPEVTPNQ